MHTFQVNVFWIKDQKEETIALAFIPAVGDWFRDDLNDREGKVKNRSVELQRHAGVDATIATIVTIEVEE